MLLRCMKVFLIFIVCGCHLLMADAQSWLTPWQARQSVSIWNYNVANFSDHQVRLEIPYHECMDSTFADIRFTTADGTTLLDHWTMHTIPGEKAAVYVEVDLLPLYSQTTIYIYYANTAAADASDPYATLVYYDELSSDVGWSDMGSPSIDFNTLSDGTTVLTKEENCDNSGAWKSIGAEVSTWKLLTRERRTTVSSGDDCYGHQYGIETPDFTGTGFYRDGIGYEGQAYTGLDLRDMGEVAEQILDEVTAFGTEWYYTEVSHCDICLFNLNAIIWNSAMEPINSVYHYNYNMLVFDRFTIRGGSPYEVDFIAVANKSCIEPMPTFGVVETCPEVVLVSHTPDECETGEGEITIAIDAGTVPYEVCWYMNGDSLGSLILSQSDTITLDSLVLGTYTITVKDSIGCER